MYIYKLNVSQGTHIMSAKKHKRKSGKPNNHIKKSNGAPSLLSRYPRLFLTTGGLFVIVAILLLSIGYISDARIGLSMIALFFGVALVIFSIAALPKKH